MVFIVFSTVSCEQYFYLWLLTVPKMLTFGRYHVYLYVHVKLFSEFNSFVLSDFIPFISVTKYSFMLYVRTLCFSDNIYVIYTEYLG